MINPDQIVTAELLAGLTKCPFCGAKPYEIKPKSKEFECHSVLHTESRAASCVSSWCQIATLRARVKELEEVGSRLAKAASRFRVDYLYDVEDSEIPIHSANPELEIQSEDNPTAGEHVELIDAIDAWEKAKGTKP